MKRLLPALMTLTMLLFVLYTFFMEIVPGIISEQVKHDLMINDLVFVSVSSMFFYSYALMQIPIGIYLDRFGAKTVLSFAMLLSFLGTSVFVLAENAELMGIARFVIGIGASGAYIGFLFIAAQLFKPEQFPIFVGVAELAIGIAGLLTAPFNDVVTHLGWRLSLLIFVVVMAICTIIFICIRNLLSHKTDKAPHGLIVSIRYICGNVDLLKLGLLAFMIWFPLLSFVAYWATHLLINDFHYTRLQSMSECSVVWLTEGISCLCIGWITKKSRNYLMILFGCLSVGCISMTLLIFANTSHTNLVTLLFVGIGIAGSAIVIPFSIINEVLPEAYRGTGLGFINFSLSLSAPLGQLLIAYLLSNPFFHTTLHRSLWLVVLNYLLAIFLGIHIIRKLKYKNSL